MKNMKVLQTLIAAMLKGPAVPDKEYILSGYTYSDVYSIAAGLRERFSRPDMTADTPVCICTEDKGIIMAALLASLCRGPATVLPYSLSPKALEEARRSIRFKYAVTDGSVELPDGITGIAPERGAWKALPLGGARPLDSVFLELFTGGSTDKPKVWSKTPINMFNETDFLRAKYRVSSNDLFASTVPPYHIYGLLYSVLMPFLASASVLGRIYVFPQEILTALKDFPVTAFISVPVHYRVLKGTQIKSPALRIAFSSAGPLDPNDGIYFYRKTGIGVEEIYGSTETGGVACKCAARGRELLEPFDWVECKIKKDRLCVRSTLISPDLRVDDEGFFMTGDRVEFSGANLFKLLGRGDGVVKVGGKRIDLIAIQDGLKEIPEIRDALVVSVDGRKGRGAEIAAAVETALSEDQLRVILMDRFEPLAVPRRLRIVDKIPVTSTGKYDREAVRKLFLGAQPEGGR
jgi:acyl-coenzyme A synthetase/AMP-(fatty) acid ligase